MFQMGILKTTALLAFLAAACFGQPLPPDLQAKVDVRLRQIQAWSTDATIVAAVKAYNSAPPAEARDLTNDKWKNLSILDPTVRGLTSNPLGQYLKTKKDAAISECFVSGADGGKVAFLSKTTSWNHKGKDKHMLPMAGKTYTGLIEMDASTGVQEVQVAVPVLDGAKPIGSIVVGLAVAKL
jgi:hypothetical protein